MGPKHEKYLTRKTSWKKRNKERFQAEARVYWRIVNERPPPDQIYLKPSDAVHDSPADTDETDATNHGFSLPIFVRSITDPLCTQEANVMHVTRTDNSSETLTSEDPFADEPVYLSTSQVMPHINFQLGHKSEGLVNAMTDSCAGVSMGRLQYHKSVYEQAPHLVYRFSYLKDVVNMKAFDIGGVSSNNSTEVIAIIVYKTPFVLNGKPMNLVIGLAEDCAANTILGLTFLRTIQATFVLHGEPNTIVSALLGQVYPIDYHVPLCGRHIPACGEGNQVAFQIPTDSIDEDLNKDQNEWCCEISRPDIVA